jgi:uncharacterized repeat protein (TIGR03847 family)
VPNLELDPVEEIAVATIGDPGARAFFLCARSRGRTLTLSCEKAQVQALLVRLQQLLESQGMEAAKKSERTTTLQPGDPEWKVAEMGLGYHESRGMFVIVASETAAAEGSTPDEAASTIRFWLSAEQVQSFSQQAEQILTAGRPLCPRCGLPMDPGGHPCPASNGARPIF